MCTRIFWDSGLAEYWSQGGTGKPPPPGSGRHLIVGRNMDWVEDMHSTLWVFPKGMKRDGGAKKNPLKWTSRHGSIVTSSYGEGTVRNGGVADGMNDQCLAGSALWLAETAFGPRVEELPGLGLNLWLQFFLDTCATVAEAVELTRARTFQLGSGAAGDTGRIGANHLVLTDKLGEVAVIEYLIEGTAVHYSGDLDGYAGQYSVLANSPTYREQLARLREFEGFGGHRPLPGSHESAARFVRAAYYLKLLPPDPADHRTAIAGVLSVMRNVAHPFHAANDKSRPESSRTIWRTAADLTQGIYFFESSIDPTIVWLDVKKISFDAGSGLRKVDLQDRHRGCSGEVSGLLEQVSLPDFPFQGEEETKEVCFVREWSPGA